MSKHPLNKVYQSACPRSKWTWDEDRNIFVGGFSGREWCLGDRRIVPGGGTRYVGFTVDKNIFGATEFTTEGSAFSFLLSAQHKEYGCRLWSEYE